MELKIKLFRKQFIKWQNEGMPIEELFRKAEDLLTHLGLTWRHLCKKKSKN